MTQRAADIHTLDVAPPMLQSTNTSAIEVPLEQIVRKEIQLVAFPATMNIQTASRAHPVGQSVDSDATISILLRMTSV